MPFSVLEIFKKNQTVEFYEFRRAFNFWRYTSSDTDVVYLGNTYYSPARPIKRSRIAVNGELAQQNLIITLPAGDDIVQVLTAFPVGALTFVTVFAQHRGQADTIQLFAGRFVNWKYKGDACELRFDSDMTARKESGLRRTASPMCAHTLYDVVPLSCGVVKNNFKTTAVLSIVADATLTSSAFSAFADGWFAGGFIEFMRPDGIVDQRSIDTHVGNVITLRAQVPGLEAGSTVNAYPGCDHTLPTCNTKFSNSVNFGGLPFVPEFNPYDGNPIF
jgi:uncharacterized phage protein (TIGR02218 family)